MAAMAPPSPPLKALKPTRARNIALNVLFALVACGQVLCVLELAGVPLPKPGIILGTESVIVVSAGIVGALRGRQEPGDMRSWSLVGLGMWIVWGSLYFGAAKITDPPNARTFSDSLLARLPLVPAFTPLYLGVHVFSMIPYCVLPEQRLLRRYLLGNMLIVFLSAILWVVLPVRLDRPPFSAEIPGFGAWLLRGVYSGDPTTNCFPSAHCAVAVYGAIGMRFASRRIFVWGVVSATAICISTVMTKQHYVADVFAGAVLAALAAYAIGRRERRPAAESTR
jgi:membrane-associated phospholipid phosphatase